MAGIGNGAFDGIGLTSLQLRLLGGVLIIAGIGFALLSPMNFFIGIVLLIAGVALLASWNPKLELARGEVLASAYVVYAEWPFFWQPGADINKGKLFITNKRLNASSMWYEKDYPYESIDSVVEGTSRWIKLPQLIIKTKDQKTLELYMKQDDMKDAIEKIKVMKG